MCVCTVWGSPAFGADRPQDSWPHTHINIILESKLEPHPAPATADCAAANIPAAAMLRPFLRAAVVAAASAAVASINRQAVVRRHNVDFALGANASIDPMDVLTVGNGCFAVGLDLLGSQTLNGTYSETDLNVLADWLSHTQPAPGSNPNAYLDDYNTTTYETPTDGAGGVRRVRYPTGSNNTGPGATWTHANPHKPSAFQLSLRLTTLGGGASATPLALGDVLPGATSALNLWTGTVAASATLAGGVSVRSAATVHPDLDLFAMTVAVSGAAPGADAALSLRLAFAYAVGNSKPSEWSHAYDASHSTALSSAGGASAAWIARTVDNDSYSLRCEWALTAGGVPYEARLEQSARHVLDLILPEVSTARASTVLPAPFAPVARLPLRACRPPTTSASAASQCRGARAAARRTTRRAGGCLGWRTRLPRPRSPSPRGCPPLKRRSQPLPRRGRHSGPKARFSTSPRPLPTRRRSSSSGASSCRGEAGHCAPPSPAVPRSHPPRSYLMRAHEACAAPPQETGLLLNSWSGKHHLEMCAPRPVSRFAPP